MNRNEHDHKKLQGADADLETSLKEYGLAWIETDTEILFYYGITYSGEAWTRFDFSSIDKGLDIFAEYDWADFSAVESFYDVVLKDVDLLQQIQALVSYCGYENIFGSTYWKGLIYPQVIVGDVSKIRLKDIEDLGEHFSAEDIAGFAEPFDGIQHIRVINKFYRDQDESNLWPINNEYNVTERAIKNVRKMGSMSGTEYCYAVEAEISRLVNKE